MMDGYTKQEMMRRFGLTVALSLAVIFMVTPAAWSMGRTGTDTCADGSMGTCMENMLTKQDDLLVDVEGLISDMDAMGLFSLGSDRSGVGVQELLAEMSNLRQENRRALEANASVADLEYNQSLEHGDTEKGGNCQLSDKPFYDALEGDLESIGLTSAEPKFGNERCDSFGGVDLAGNNVRVNERKENMCEQVCEVKKNNGNSRQGETKSRFNQSMIESIDSVSAAIQTVAVQRANINAMGALLVGGLSIADPSTLVDPAPCTPGVAGPSDELTEALQAHNAVMAMDIIIAVVEAVEVATGAVHGIADAVTKQDAAGFNSSTAGIVTTVIHHIAQGTKSVIGSIKATFINIKTLKDLNAQIAASDEEDTAETCREALKTDTESLTASAGDTAAALSDIQADMAVLRNLVEENRALLLTPQGKRVGFPAR